MTDNLSIYVSGNEILFSSEFDVSAKWRASEKKIIWKQEFQEIRGSE